MNERSDPILLTPTEVADILRIDRATLEELIFRGELAALKVGAEWRIPVEAVSEFLSRGLQEQLLRSLQWLLGESRERARHLLAQPELAKEIESKTFPEGSVGEMLQKDLAAFRAEVESPNVIPFPRRDED